MRTDIRGCSGSIAFGLPGDLPAGSRRARGAAEPTASIWPAATVALDSRPVAGAARSGDWRAAACCSAASTSWSREHGDLLRPLPVHDGRRSARRQVRRAARRLLVGRHAALRAHGRGDRAAAAHALGAFARRRRFRPHADRARRRRRSHRAGRNRQPRRRRPPACTAGPIEILVGPRARLRYVNLQNWGTGVWHFAHQQGAGRPRRRAAMDHRRAGQPAGQGQSARGPGRPGRRRAGQRRDVHRRQAAPLLPHAAAPPGAALHERSALQGRLAGQVAARVAGHDQGRPRRPEDRRLSARRQPDALRRRPGRLDPRAWRSRPTT